MEYLKLEIVPPAVQTTVDIEAAIEDMFLSAFRAIFKHDREFTYSDDPAQSRLALTMEYPSKDVPLQKPHILLTGISYSMNLNSTFKRNMLADSFNLSGFNDKTVSAQIIPYNVTLMAFGGKSVSKNLANRIVNYINSTYKAVFDDLGLNISGLSKAPTSNTMQYPEKVFETTIGVQGSLSWSDAVACIEREKEHVVEAVNIGFVVNQ